LPEGEKRRRRRRRRRRRGNVYLKLHVCVEYQSVDHRQVVHVSMLLKLLSDLGANGRDGIVDAIH
jgi:hypothetical protein